MSFNGKDVARNHKTIRGGFMTVVTHQSWVITFLVACFFVGVPGTVADVSDDFQASSYRAIEQPYLLAFTEGCEGCEEAKDCEGCKGCTDCEKIEVVYAADKGGAFLGVYPIDLDDEKREALDYKGKYGVLVENIVEDGPAVKAGVEPGDIIIKMDDKNIASNEELRKVLADRKPGDKMQLIVIRDGKEKKIKMKLGSRPKESYSKMDIIKKYAFLGVTTTELSEQLMEYFKVDNGVLVETVHEDTPAEKSGIKAGDVIYELGGEEIEDTEDLTEAIREHKVGDEVEVKLIRDGKKMTIKATLTEREFPSFKAWTDDELFLHFQPEDIDVHEIKKIVKEALKNVDIELEKGREDLEKSMEELKMQMKKLQDEMEKLKEKD